MGFNSAFKGLISSLPDMTFSNKHVIGTQNENIVSNFIGKRNSVKN
jgi:hypothetical protein